MSGRKVSSNTYPLKRLTSRILTDGQHVDRTYDVVIRKLKNGYLSDDADSENEFWESPILASEFSPAYNQTVLAYANEFGKLFLWKMKRKLVRPLHMVQAHEAPIYDLVWTPKEEKILTVSDDKTAVLWDANGPTVGRISTFHAHQTTIKSAAWNPESDSIFATGDKNSSIFLWDRRLLGPVKKIYQAHDHSNVSRHCKSPYSDKTSITGIGFNGTHCLITCAAVSECIKFWDMRNTASAENPHSIKQLRYPEYSDKSGYAYLTIDHTRQWLYVTTVEDRIYAFALSTSEITPTAVFIGACLRSFHIKSSLSPDGQYLVSGSSGDCSMIWRTKENVGRVVKPLRKLETYGSEVNAVSWSRTPGDSFKVVTFPEYRSVQVWDINPINVPEGLWEIMAPLPDDGDFSSDDKVSDVDEKLKLNERSWMGWSELSCHSKFDVSISLRGASKQSESLNCDNQAQKKCMALEVLETCSEESQTKKIKLRQTLSTRNLFVCSNRNYSNEIDSVKQISCRTES